MSKSSKTAARTATFDRILVVVAILPLIVFHRWFPDAFDMPKAITSVIGGALLLSWGILVSSRAFVADRLLHCLLGVFLIGLIVSALMNPNFALAFHGTERRYTGLVLWIAATVGLLSVRNFSVESTKNRLLVGLFFASWPFNVYAFLQATDNDPFKWNIVSFSSDIVFSTQGNPNFASWTCFLFIGGGIWMFVESHSLPKSLLAACSISWTVVNLTLTNSIQGQFAVVVMCAVMAVIGVAKANGESRKLFIPSMVVLLLVGVAYVARTRPYALPIVFVVGVLILLLGSKITADLSVRSFRRSGFASSFFLVIGGALYLVSNPGWFGSQFGERAAFYRAGWSMFQTSPFVGVGLERYGRLFALHRPSWHARDLPGSLSSSAHSMWLGLLISGGLLLVLPLLIVAGLSAFRSLKGALSDTSFSGDTVLCGLVFSSIAVWLVAVEQPSTVFVTMLIFGLGLVSPRRSLTKRIRDRKNRLFPYQAVFACVVLLLAVIYSVRVSLGNRAQVDAYAAIFERNDIDEGIRLLDRAVAFGPTPSEATAIRGNLFSQLGVPDLAIRDALAAAEQFEYSGQTPIASAQTLIQYGELEGARHVLLLAIEKNPGFESVQAEARRLLESLPPSESLP